MANRTITLSDKEKDDIVYCLKSYLSNPAINKLNTKLENAFKPRAARYGKSKGAATQKEAAQWLADLLEIEWDNQDDNSPIQTRSMGLSGQDLILRGVAFAEFFFDAEVKAVESLSVPATITQAKANTKKGREWLIYWKKKAFDEPVIIMTRKAFERLWRRNS